MKKGNCYPSDVVSIRKEVCKLLDENQLLTAKMICKLMNLPYKKYRRTVTNYRCFWKYNHENERGSKCSNFHCYKAKTKLDLSLSDDLRAKLCFGVVGGFVGYNWQLSKAKNRFLVWKGKLGRVVWFSTGLVTLEVKRPGNLGRAKQLFCDAFVNSGLLTDFKLLNPVLERLGPKSCHFPYETSMRLPYVQINDFAESYGIVIKLGDWSHPNAVEVIAEYTNRLSEVEEKVSFVFGVFQEVKAKQVGVDPERFGGKSLDRLGEYSR